MNRKAIAGNWLAKAAGDLRWCEVSIKGSVWHGACFSAQQTVEKALKAFLISRGTTVHRIHDLAALLEQCRKVDASFETIRERVLPLVDYYLQTRYPDMGDFIDYTKEKAEQALENARMIVNFVSSQIK